jgi:hypothetical protein
MESVFQQPGPFVERTMRWWPKPQDIPWKKLLVVVVVVVAANDDGPLES